MFFAKTIFELVGGESKLDNFIDEFARRIKESPKIGALYPEDMTRIKRAYRDYAMELFDGPKAFSGSRGGASLKDSHASISITKERADEMLKCARGTMEHFHLPNRVQEAAIQRLQAKVYDMVNA